MQAIMCLRAPQLSPTFHSPRNHDNFSYRNLRTILSIQTSPSLQSISHGKTLASVARAAVVTVTLASALGFICPSWSRGGRIGLAAPWYDISITSGGEGGRPEGKRHIKRKELQKQVLMRQQIVADRVLVEMFERKDLPAKFYKITPNYPKIKEYFENNLRLCDESLETLIRKWKEIKPGPDQIEIGLLLIDLCIIKGDIAVANDIDKEIIKTIPELDQRLKIRRAIVNMIRDWDKKKGEKKAEWEQFAKEMQDILSSPFIDEPEEEP